MLPRKSASGAGNSDAKTVLNPSPVFKNTFGPPREVFNMAATSPRRLMSKVFCTYVISVPSEVTSPRRNTLFQVPFSQQSMRVLVALVVRTAQNLLPETRSGPSPVMV